MFLCAFVKTFLSVFNIIRRQELIYRGIALYKSFNKEKLIIIIIIITVIQRYTL